MAICFFFLGVFMFMFIAVFLHPLPPTPGVFHWEPKKMVNATFSVSDQRLGLVNQVGTVGSQ